MDNDDDGCDEGENEMLIFQQLEAMIVERRWLSPEKRRWPYDKNDNDDDEEMNKDDDGYCYKEL